MLKYKTNYYNIIPILLIEIIIVYIFEYIIYIYSINPSALKITNRYLSNYTQQSFLLFNNDNTKIANSTSNENNYISKQKIYSILTLLFIILGVILLLLLYDYVIVNIIKKNIEWFLVSMTVIGITLLIIFIECIYIYVIEHESENTKNYYDYFIKMNNTIINYSS